MDLNLGEELQTKKDGNYVQNKGEINDDLNDLIKNKNSCLSKRNIIIIVSVSSAVVITAIILIVLLIKPKNMEDNANHSDQSDKDDQDDHVDYSKIRLKNWEFVSSEKIQLEPEQISKGEKPELFNKAPEDFYVCTAMGGLSGKTNKFYYDQELKNVDKEQFDVDWWFRSHFDLNISNREDILVILHINGINYKSDVYIDGNLVAKKDQIIGTFVKYSLDISDYLDKKSTIHYIAFKMSRPHNQWNGDSTELDLAISFVDWNPEAPDSNMGIWQPVDVEMFRKKVLTVSSAFIRTEIIGEEKINLEIVLHIKNWNKTTVKEGFSVKFGDFINFDVEEITFESLEEKQIVLNKDKYSVLSIAYDANKLWWPYQMGNQQMHNLEIKLKETNYTRQLGLKQIEREYDSEKKIVVYKINKRKILLKGAGWTPDLFLRQSPENYYTHIKYVKDMGLNVIRLEGKSEGEEFYDYCDKMGVLVIPGWNCADAWQKWKYWDEPIKQLSDKSVISQIRKLSPHPSVIIFILGSDYGPTNRVEERWRKIFDEEKWPNEILSSAAAASPADYPTGVKMSGPYSWVPPNYFFLEKSRNNGYGGAYGFLTEGGPGENPLRKGSIEKIYNETNLEDYTGQSWNYHCGNKGVFGNLSKIILPINERLGNITNFDDFMRKSSAIVYEGHRAMFEAYECYRYESTGVIQWMLNNAWPSNIWHLYDYFFAPTPSYYATKKSTERIHAMFNYENNSVYLINNYFFDFNSIIDLAIFVIDSTGKNIIFEIGNEMDIFKSDEIKKIIELNDDYGDNYIVHLEYSYTLNEKTISLTNTYFLNKQMDVIDYEKTPTFYNAPIISYADLKFLQNLEKVTLAVEILSKSEFEENGQKKVRYNFKITNKGETIALLLEIKLFEKSGEKEEMIVPIIWRDNYFSIRKRCSYESYAEFVYNKDKELYINIVGWNSELNQKLN